MITALVKRIPQIYRRIFFASSVVFFVSGYVLAATPQPPDCKMNSGCSGSTCLSSISSSAATAPTGSCPKFGEAQGGVDVFSWNLFIALNWPANTSTCTADTSKSITDVKGNYSGQLVWETWLTDADIFVASGSPKSWCGSSARKILKQTGKVHPAVKGLLTNTNIGNTIEEAVGGVLTDQNGRFVRFEVMVNSTEYNYIVTNNLWNKSGQTTYTNTNTVNFPAGSIEIKMAWKVLDATEISSNSFYMTQATVYNDESGAKSPGKNPVTVGLVGFHMVFKDPIHSHLWATFEHKDNAPTKAGKKNFSFYNGSCSGSKCAQNTQYATTPYTELDSKGNPLNTPTQVVRVNPIDTNDPGVASLNAYYRNLLKGSVFANYKLVGTQWSTGGAPNGTPAILANTVIETYNQSTSTCIGCHKGAQTANGKSADFSFIMGEAQ